MKRPTYFEHRLQEEPSDAVPNLPHAFNFKEEDSRKNETKHEIYGVDADDLMSSSPVAQSTPRIRLEPTFEKDGRRILKNVSAQSPSLFDPDNSSLGDLFSDMDLDISSFDKRSWSSLLATRKSWHGQEMDATCSDYQIKKHPSPSKIELEGFQRALRQDSDFGRTESLHQDGLRITLDLQPRSHVLVPREANKKLHVTSKRQDKAKRFGVFPKLEFTRSTSSMTEIPSRSKSRTLMIPKPVPAIKKLGNQALNSQEDEEDASMMDIDELQWDQTALMKKG